MSEETKTTEALAIRYEDIKAVEVFDTTQSVDTIIQEISKAAKAVKQDITTDTGRKLVARTARTVAKFKTLLDGKGKDFLAVQKAAMKETDVLRKKLRDDLDEVRDEIRKPLTDWEEAEEARAQKIEEEIQNIKSLANEYKPEGGKLDSTQLRYKINTINEYSNTHVDFGDRLEEAKSAIEQSLTTLNQLIVAREEEEAQAIEIERLKKQAEEQAQKDRDAEIKRQAEEEARLRAEAEAAERLKAAELEKKNAEEASKRALEAKDRELQEAKDREEQAKRDAAKAEEQAKFNADQAVEQERLRVEAEQAEIEKAEKAEADRKAELAANEDHREKITSGVKESMKFIGNIDDNSAQLIVNGIIAGTIPNLTIQF